MSTPDLPTVLAAERGLMNEYAPYYHQSYFINSYFYREERNKFMEWVTKTLQADRPNATRASILNVGCATGDMLEWLAGRGFIRISGLDIAEDMLDIAEKRVPSARLIQGSIEHHPFGEEKFDAILAGFTLHHMHRPGAFFEMADQLLTPGGWFFILEYNAAGWENLPVGRKVVHALSIPLRRLIKWQNRHSLAKQPDLPLRFNPAHRLLSYREILASMPSKDRYALQHHTRGVFLPAFNYALVGKSALDQAVYRSLDLIDRVAEPFGAGNLQWIAGRQGKRDPG
jgi:SAM-dependent methyltransferase